MDFKQSRNVMHCGLRFDLQNLQILKKFYFIHQNSTNNYAKVTTIPNAIIIQTWSHISFISGFHTTLEMGPCIENELSKCVLSGLTNFIDKETEESTRDLPNSIQIV